MRISDWSSDVCSSDLTDCQDWPQSDAVAHHRTTSPRTIVDAGRNCQATRVGIRHDRSSRRWPLWERIDGKATSQNGRSEEHTSELQSLMRISYAVFCWKKKNTRPQIEHDTKNQQ